jgi:hypothetical protein
MYYLVEFNDEINKVVKTHGLNLNNDGTFRIDYIEEPTQDQLSIVNDMIQKYPLFCKKMEKLEKIQEEWNQTIAQGWDSGQGILGISAEDVALLSANFSMAKEAANLGYPIPPIITVDSQEISFSDIQSMTVFMLQYGEFRSSISKTFAARRRAVQNASTIEEVVVI